MKLVEIRDLDGPNLFSLHPAIKLEVGFDRDDSPATMSSWLDQFTREIQELHRVAGLPPAPVSRRELDLPGHVALAFSWEWRSTSLMIAERAFHYVASGQHDPDVQQRLHAALARDRERDDRPEWIRDVDRHVPTVGITGTNGKTSTSRLLAYMAEQAGHTVGLTGSAGIFVGGETVTEGDYSGPSGARRVLTDPSVTLAVLEAARGGILLRGLGFESSDVSILLNISADHLSLQGVERLETLAEVKSVVIQVTKPDGVAVLNADDPRVMAQRVRTRAAIMLFSQTPDNPVLADHIRQGGRALECHDGTIRLYQDGQRANLIGISQVPATYAGAAPHMVENALAATAAAVSLGIDVDVIRDSLRTFRSDARLNTGRLNMFRLDGRIVIVDYAHNESGLEMLLAFARRALPNKRVSVVIGTAGDRQDAILRGIGRIAGEQADRIYVKENPKYLRGRSQDEINALVLAGVSEARADGRLAGIYPTEYDATFTAISDARVGDVVAVMCVEDQRKILNELSSRGAQEWQPSV